MYTRSESPLFPCGLTGHGRWRPEVVTQMWPMFVFVLSHQGQSIIKLLSTNGTFIKLRIVLNVYSIFSISVCSYLFFLHHDYVVIQRQERSEVRRCP